MSEQTLGAMTQSLRRTLTDFIEARNAVLGDPRLSDLGKGERINALRDAAYREAAATAQRIWGKVNEDTGQWEGGLAWRTLEAALERLREARDEADTLDPDRVQAALERLQVRLRNLWTLADVGEFYDLRADSFERRALQLHGERLLDRFRGDSGFIPFLSDLAADLEQELYTDEVRAAEAALERLDGLLLNAYEQVRRAAAIFGDTVFLGRGQGPFGDILAAVERLDVGHWERRPTRFIAIKWPQEVEPPDTGETDEEKRKRLLGG